jgi:3-oxoacyl-[acyl-carrier-protein] synthase II
MAADRDIVVTGLGIVSPIGIGTDPFWTALCAGRSGIQRLAFDDPGLPRPIGGVVADFDPKQYVRPRKSLKVMSRDIQLGFAAADMACVDAKLRDTPPDPDRLGVMLGADMIPCELEELIGVYQNCLVDGQFDFSRWGSGFVADLFPLWMLKYLPNMPACHIGIAQDARGPNNTITLGEVSTLSAISEAARVLQRGQADAMITGGVSSRIHPLLWARSQVMGQSQRGGDPATALRPFDALRDGAVSGEGAAALIVETQSHAHARSARVLARILGYASACEPRSRFQPGHGKALRRVIGISVQAAGLGPEEIGFVVAHGSGTVDGDRLEAQAIRDTLGDVPVTAAKGYYGHLGAAAGALEMALCVLAFQHELIPPTLNYEHPDPQCPINVVHGRPLPLGRPTALVLGHSTHGQAVALVVGGVEWLPSRRGVRVE